MFLLPGFYTYIIVFGQHIQEVQKVKVESILQCPSCEPSLKIRNQGFFCDKCDRQYSKRAGLYDFLLSGEDQWARVGKGFMNGQEEMERRLLETPLEELSPSDRLIRAVALWFKGDFEEYEKIAKESLKGVYTDEYNDAMKKSFDNTVDLVRQEEGIVLDLATGMGGLLQKLLSSTERDFISVDISPTSSLSLLQYLRFRNWDNRVVQLIADAAHLPLRDKSIDVITTAVGFQNMQDAEPVFKEIRRVSRKLVALCIFMDKGDTNLAFVKDKSLHVADLFKKELEKVGWSASLENTLRACVEPTPQSEILGIRPDRIPVVPTVFEFTTVVAE